MFSFIGTILRLFFNGIGTTVLGWIVNIAFASSLLATVLLKTNREQGWRAMMNHWRQEYRNGIRFTLLCAFIIYLPVIIWAAGRAVYQDHEYFVGTAKRLQASIRLHKEASSGVQKGLEGQISDWKAKCAGYESANGVLTNQNRDQQNTINNCQSKALQLLVPAPLHIETISTGQELNLTQKKVQYLFLTNKNISPVRVLVRCNQDIAAMALGPAIQPNVVSTPKEQWKSHRIYEKSFNSPAWTPNAPLVANVTFEGSQGDCSASSE